MSDEVKKNITRIGDYPIQPGQKASDFTVTQPEIEGKPVRKEGESVLSFGARMSAFQRNEQLNQFIILSPSGEAIDLGGKTFDDYEEANKWVKKYFPNQPDLTIKNLKKHYSESALNKLKDKIDGNEVEFTEQDIRILNDQGVYFDEPGNITFQKPTTKSTKEKDADSLERLIKGQGTEADSLKQYKDFPQFTPGSVTKLHKEGLAVLNKEKKDAVEELKKIKEEIKTLVKKTSDGGFNKNKYYSLLTQFNKEDELDLVRPDVFDENYTVEQRTDLFEKYKEQSNIIKSIEKRIKDHREGK